MNLVDLFDLSLHSEDGQVGLEFAGQEFIFRQLENRSNRLAHRLAEDGFDAGDRIAVYLPNCVELIGVYLAAVKLGLIFVPINVLYRDREIEHILTDAEPKGVVTSADLQPLLAPGLRRLEECSLYLAEDFYALTREYPNDRPPCPADGDSPAAIVYTSGTTGRSKGAVLTHNNFAANAVNLNTCWRMSRDDRLLLALPLFHVHGLGNGLHTWLSSAYRLRLLERFAKETILDEFLDFQPTVFFGVPTMYERLLEIPSREAREIGSFMRLFVSGSAPLPARTLERFRELYGHVILERYGMSETMMNTSNPYGGERRAGSVGKPLPGVSLRLDSPQAGDTVSQGEVGELLVRGPNVFGGYWKRPLETAEVFTEDGYFRTGDLAVRSPDGYYTLVGRCKEVILCGGFNIYPREVEEFLEEQLEVEQAAVVGQADTVRGEVPVAYVVLVVGVELPQETLQHRCQQHLASYKVPRRIVFVQTLPRNALGKVQKHQLAGTDQAP